MLTRRAWRRFGRSAALGALLLAMLPGAACALNKALWGLPYRGGVNQFPLYHRLGASIDELHILWSSVAPTRPADPTDPNDPAYQWPAEVDQAVALAGRYHIRMMLQLLFAPGWANGGQPPNWAPTDPRDFAAFATAAARRYPSVHLWMIWGEANRSPTFEPIATVPPGQDLTPSERVGPHRYARVLDAAYGALKRVSRKNLVIGGSTYTGGDIVPRQWIMNLRLPNGKPPRMDMYAHNPFGWRPPVLTWVRSPYGEVQFADLRRLAGWIDRYLHKGIPLFLSEWTLPTAPDQEFRFWVDAPVAASWISQALSAARHWKRIYALGWVHVYDNPPTTYGGLLTSDGRPKPGFRAFQRG